MVQQQGLPPWYRCCCNCHCCCHRSLGCSEHCHRGESLPLTISTPAQRCHRHESGDQYQSEPSHLGHSREYKDSHACGPFPTRAKAHRNPVPVERIYNEDDFLDKRGRSAPRLPLKQDYPCAHGKLSDAQAHVHLAKWQSKQSADEASEGAMNFEAAAETFVAILKNAERFLDIFFRSFTREMSVTYLDRALEWKRKVAQFNKDLIMPHENSENQIYRLQEEMANASQVSMTRLALHNYITKAVARRWRNSHSTNCKSKF